MNSTWILEKSIDTHFTPDTRAPRHSVVTFIALTVGLAILMLKAPPARAADPSPTSATQPQSPYRITFDNHATVEILAVSTVPSRHKPFWTPDGMRIIPAPYTSIDGGYKHDDRNPSFEITLRVADANDQPSVRAFMASPNQEVIGPIALQADGKNDLRVFDCPLPRDTDSMDLDIGVATNDWKLIQSFKTLGDYGDGLNKISVVDVQPWQKNSSNPVRFYVRVTPTQCLLQLVAVDEAGNRHISTGSYMMQSDQYTLMATFPDLPGEKVKEYRVEECAYEWKRFKGIHLKPKGDWQQLVAKTHADRLAAQEHAYKPDIDSVRIDDDIEKIEHLSPFDETSDAWVTAIRDVSEIGAPAMPSVVAELRRTGRPYERSGLAMALRAIDDPRSIPGLIDALADCPFGPNDYGGERTGDPALTHFMLSIQDNNMQFDVHAIGFNVGRPVNEIRRTLEALAGLEASPHPITADARSQYQEAADRWRHWWDNNRAATTKGLPLLRFTGDAEKQSLNLAIVSGQSAEAKKLIDGGADVNCAAADGWTPLHIAAATGQVETTQYLLDHNADIDRRTVDGCTPLHAAVGLGITPVYAALPDAKIEIVELLLDHNADARAVNARGQTPLHGAAAFDDPDMVQLLIDHGALVNAKDNRGRTALHRAVQCDHPLVVDHLLSAGADVNAKDLKNQTPIRMCTMSLSYPKYNSPIVQQLLNHGAEVSLNTTIVLGDVDQLAAALKKHPALNEKPAREDRCSLDWAIAQSPEKVRMLLDAGADPNQHEADGNTPLHAAVFMGDPQIVSMLIAAKADVNAAGQQDEPPMFWACLQLKADLVDMLLDAGAKPGVCGVQYRSSLISLAMQGVTDRMTSGSPRDKINRAKRIISSLLAHGADINERVDNGLLPLFGADGEMGEFLLAHGAKIDVVDGDGNSPLHFAAVMSNVDAVKFLLQHHVPLEAENKKGETPLLYCAGFAPQHGVVKLLLDAGADVSARDLNGSTALHLAVKKVHNTRDPVIEQLLDKGADPNAKDHDGLTPLHEAARMGSDQVIRTLLKHGADATAKDAGGRTPLQWATSDSTIALLRSQGTTPVAK
jgi:ankyrin repeat protein